ncbi:hypothetical protein BKA80DRAFT_270443 [Phyllosticta citrichinensis]
MPPARFIQAFLTSPTPSPQPYRPASSRFPTSPNRALEPAPHYAKAAPYESNISATMDPIIWAIILGVCEGALRENLQGTFEEVMARAAGLPRKVHRLFFFQPRIDHTQEQTDRRWIRCWWGPEKTPKWSNSFRAES